MQLRFKTLKQTNLSKTILDFLMRKLTAAK